MQKNRASPYSGGKDKYQFPSEVGTQPKRLKQAVIDFCPFKFHRQALTVHQDCARSE